MTAKVVHIQDFVLMRLNREIQEKRAVLDALISELRAYGVPEEEIQEMLRDDLELDEYEDEELE